jgi:hypothetical protein
MDWLRLRDGGSIPSKGKICVFGTTYRIFWKPKSSYQFVYLVALPGHRMKLTSDKRLQVEPHLHFLIHLCSVLPWNTDRFVLLHFANRVCNRRCWGNVRQMTQCSVPKSICLYGRRRLWHAQWNIVEIQKTVVTSSWRCRSCGIWLEVNG